MATRDDVTRVPPGRAKTTEHTDCTLTLKCLFIKAVLILPVCVGFKGASPKRAETTKGANDLMRVFASRGRSDKVLGVLAVMKQRGVARDEFSYTTAISACAGGKGGQDDPTRGRTGGSARARNHVEEV